MGNPFVHFKERTYDHLYSTIVIIPPYCNRSDNENFLFDSGSSSAHWATGNFSMPIYHIKDFCFDIANSWIFLHLSYNISFEKSLY